MAPSDVELYEALKPTVGETAARMVTEYVRPSQDVATQADIAATRTDIAATQADIAATRTDIASAKEDIARVDAKIDVAEARLRAEIHGEAMRTVRWMLGLFVPVWLGTWGTTIAVLLKT